MDSGPVQGIYCYWCGYCPPDNVEPVSGHIKSSPSCQLLEMCVHHEVLSACKDVLQKKRLASLRNTVIDDNMQPLNPKYRQAIERLITFRYWKHNSSPIKFAEAGFFKTDSDSVSCFYCGYKFAYQNTTIEGIPPADPSWIHAYCSPGCLFLQKNTPKYYVKEVQMVRRGDIQNIDRNDWMNVNNRLKFQYFKGKTHDGKPSEHPVYFAAAQYAVLQLGFYEGHVKEVIDELMKFGYIRKWNIDLLVNILLEKQEKGELTPRPERDRPEGQQESYICRKCKTRRVDALFFPCQHHVLCWECASSVLMCPSCLKEVEEKIKTYMS